MKSAKILAGVWIGVLALAGCMTDELVKQRASDERIELIGSGSFKIELLNARTLINDDGLLTVDASALLSRTGSFRWFFCGDPKVTVWYHFDWIDAEGNICPPVQREMVALPGNIVDFHGVAPEEKYITYYLTVSLKGPETKEEAARQRDKVKKQYAEAGKLKPAGKSQARRIMKTNAAKADAGKVNPKTEVKMKQPDKAAVGPSAKAEEKKEPAKPAEKAPAPTPAKPQKLTEPFD